MIFAVSGNNEVGKSTLAEALGKHYQTDLDYTGFGEMLRIFICKEYGIPMEVLQSKPTPPHIRSLLINVGIGKREESPTFWVDMLDRFLGGRSCAIGDMRFQNEANWVKERNGVLIFLGEPTDKTYELDLVFEMADLVFPVKPKFDDRLIKQVGRILKSRGYNV